MLIIHVENLIRFLDVPKHAVASYIKLNTHPPSLSTPPFLNYHSLRPWCATWVTTNLGAHPMGMSVCPRLFIEVSRMFK